MKLFLLVILCGLFLTDRASAQVFPVDTLIKSGPLDNRINIVLVAEGYTEAQMPKFEKDAATFVDQLLKETPYAQYRRYFNFFLIKVTSRESGASHPGTASDEANAVQPIQSRDTYFGASFDAFGIHRLLVINKGVEFTKVMATNFPGYDLVFLLVNTEYYGGSGGTPSTFSMHPSSSLIGIHEAGHTFAGLSDEYWAGSQYARETPNMTATKNPQTVRWRNWLTTPDIGVFEYPGGPGWYKPTQGTCVMELLGKPFCAVCRETIVDKFLTLVKPVEGTTPASGTVELSSVPTTFRLNLVKPEPNTLQVTWYLNDQFLTRGPEQLDLRAEQLKDISGKLTATVYDSTRFSQSVFHRSQPAQAVSWNLKRNVLPDEFLIAASSTSLCAGDTVRLSSTGCSGTVRWSSGQTGTAFTIRPATTTIFSATCTPSEGPARQAGPVTVEVKPLPAIVATNAGPYLEGQTVQLTGTGGGTYTWKGPDGFSSTAQNPTIPDARLTQAGAYTLTVTTAGCSASASTLVVISPITAVSPGQEPLLAISPNPSSGRFTISFLTSIPEKADIDILNVTGTVVQRAVSTGRRGRRQEVVDLSTQPAGLYWVRVRLNEEVMTGRLLLNR